MLRRIVCAGMLRSGSTWIYNVVRLLAKRYGDYESHACWGDDYNPSNTCDCHIVKVHGYVPYVITPARTIIITSHRDLRDIIASASSDRFAFGINVKEPHAIQKRLTRTIAAHEKYMSHRPLDIKYEDMVKDKPRTIWMIARWISIDISLDAAEVLHTDVENLRLPTDAGCHDEITLLHAGHRTTNDRTGYYRERLSPQAIEYIEKNFGDWLRKYQYMGA